jgi:hypothetical protein
MLSSDVKLLAVFDNLEKRLDKVQATVGQTGPQGTQGPQGPAGKDGKDGKAGSEGKDGKAGEDGVSVTSIIMDFDNHLVVELSDGSSVDAGEVQGSSSGGDSYNVSMGGGGTSIFTGTETLDFGSGAMSTSVAVTGVQLTAASIIVAHLRIEETPEHSTCDLLNDHIHVYVHNLVEGTGFTIEGKMENAKANGTYKVNWIKY